MLHLLLLVGGRIDAAPRHTCTRRARRLVVQLGQQAGVGLVGREAGRQRVAGELVGVGAHMSRVGRVQRVLARLPAYLARVVRVGPVIAHQVSLLAGLSKQGRRCRSVCLVLLVQLAARVVKVARLLVAGSVRVAVLVGAVMGPGRVLSRHLLRAYLARGLLEVQVLLAAHLRVWVPLLRVLGMLLVLLVGGSSRSGGRCRQQLVLVANGAIGGS